jgi:expansin
MAYGHQGDFEPDGPRRHRRRRGRRPLVGLGVTGAGLAAVAVAAVVGIGQLTGGQTACRTSASASAQSLPALSLSAQSLPALSLSALSEQSGSVSGTATHYVLTSLPNCSYPSPPANDLFVALSPAEYDSAAACGGYLTVTGPDGSVTVQVIDQCPDCATGHIDLSEAAFAELAPLSAGLINVHYQQLTDPPLPGPITMEVKSGSSQYWLALLADNTGNPLASVQVETASGGWLSLTRASYNYWIASSGAGVGPFTVRLTDTEGHQVTVRNVALDPGAVQSTGVFMYGAGSDPAAGAAGSSSATPSSADATASRASASASASVSPAAAAAAATGVEGTVAAPTSGPTLAVLPPTPSATC